jgi:hypothetical protein
MRVCERKSEYPIREVEAKSREPYWTPTKIAIVALGGISLTFIAYKFFFGTSAYADNASKVSSLTHASVEENIKTVANKLRVTYQNKCSSWDTAFLNEIDLLLAPIYATSKIEQFEQDGRTVESNQAAAPLHLLFERLIPQQQFHGVFHPTLEEMADSSYTTAEGLLTKERFSELKLSRFPNISNEALSFAYQEYLDNFKDFCSEASTWANS